VNDPNTPLEQARAATPTVTPSSEEESLRRSRWLTFRGRSVAISEGHLFLLLAIVIGVFAGLAVVVFRVSIDEVQRVLLGPSPALPGLRTVLAPVGAGLIVGILVQKFFRAARGSGVNQTKAAVYVFDGYVPFRTVIGKFLTCSLAIGSGQSLGPEDPSLQMGAGIASALGRRLKLSRDKLRLLAPVGASAGLAAAFNAPISAVLFVIEEVIGTWSATALGAIILAAVSSAVVMRSFLGGEPMFHVPAYTLAHPAELLAYAVLGVVSGVLSLAFTKIVAYFRPRLRAWPEWTHYFQPAAAGLLIGLVGLRVPQAMGTGYPYIDQALRNEYTWEVLAILGFTKLLTTSLSFVSGTPGGMFAPVLFIGAMMGGAIGGLEHHFFPQISASVAPFALVGMGTLFAGFLRVPITSVFMVVETSGSYSIVLPVMISNTIAYLISRSYQSAGLFDMLAKQDGFELPSMEEQREQIVLRVEDAMRTPELPPLQASDTLARALEIAQVSTEDVLLVRFPTGRWAGISRQDLPALSATHPRETQLREALSTARLPVLYPDQRLDDVLRFIQGHPLLPVVSREASRKLEGVISLPDILTAYQRVS
jgi:CIC family chloride channel protein